MTTNWKYSQDGLTASRTLDNGGQESRMVSAIAAAELAIALPADLPTIAQVRLTQVSTLTSAYLAAIQLPVTYMATTFQADSDSQNTLTKCLAAGSVPAGFYWLDATNAQVPMTFVQLQGLAGAMLIQGQVAFANLQTRKAAVLAATTVTKVLAVVW